MRKPAQGRMAHLPLGSVLDMHDSQVAGRAKGLGIRSVPAVVTALEAANSPLILPAGVHWENPAFHTRSVGLSRPERARS